MKKFWEAHGGIIGFIGFLVVMVFVVCYLSKQSFKGRQRVENQFIAACEKTGKSSLECLGLYTLVQRDPLVFRGQK